MKPILSLVILLAALCAAVTPVSATPPTPPPVDGMVVLNPPTVWPQSLDHLYQLIDTRTGNWIWDNPCPADIRGPVLYWRDAKDLYTADENELFYRGMFEYMRGNLSACKPVNDRVMFYGPALVGLLEMTTH